MQILKVRLVQLNRSTTISPARKCVARAEVTFNKTPTSNNQPDKHPNFLVMQLLTRLNYNKYYLNLRAQVTTNNPPIKELRLR